MSSAERLILLPVAAGESSALLFTLEHLFVNSSRDARLCVVAPATLLASLTPQLAEAWPDARRLIMLSGEPLPWRLLTRSLHGTLAEADRLLLRPGVRVPPLWDLRLALAAAKQADAGLIQPLCETLPLLAVFGGKVPEDADARVRRVAEGRLFQIPAAYSGCLWLAAGARHALESSNDGDGGTDGREIVAALARHGWLSLACDRIHVEDMVDRQAERRQIMNLPDTSLIESVHPLTGLRWRVQQAASDEYSTDPLARRPRQLHIAHSWGGGLNRWIQLYCQHDESRDNLVLRSIGTPGRFGQRIALYRGAAMDIPLTCWDLAYPIRGLMLRHLEYRAILRQIIADYGIEAVLVSSLIGHSLDALDSGLPTRMIAHDYFPFCPAIVTYFGEVCTACDRDRLQRCSRDNPINRFFANTTADEWLAARDAFSARVIQNQVGIVAPSPSVVEHWRTLMPRLPAACFTIIPHGLDYRPQRLTPPDMNGRLRVLVLGSLAPQKGRALLEAILPRLSARVDLYLLGCDEDGSRFVNRHEVTIIPSYTHAELDTRVAEIQPHMGLLLSIWPETFSYTLSELWLMGVPVVATRLGSFADRITPGVNGWLCAPTPEGVLDALAALDEDRTALAHAWQHLRHFEHRAMQDMLMDYNTLTPLPELSRDRLCGHALERSDTAHQPYRNQAIYVDAQVPFRDVLAAFGRYTHDKIAASPRLRAWQRKVLGRLLRLMLSVLCRLARKPRLDG